MLPAGTDLQYESSVSSFEDELLENIRPNLISLTLSGSFSSHFESDNKSFNGDLLLSSNKEMNNSLDSFTVILNPCANDEVEVSSLKSCPNNSQNSFKNINIIKVPSVNTINEQKSRLPLDCHLPQSKKWTSLHDLNVKVPSVSGPSHSTTTVCSVTKSRDSGLTKTPSRLSLFGTSKCFGDTHVKDEKYNETFHQTVNERTASSSLGINEETELVDILQKELKLKDNIIEQIQQNYLDLLKKYAEAENKIDKLRIKVIHPSSDIVPPSNSIKQLRQSSKHLHQNTSQIKTDDVSHHSSRKLVNSQFPPVSHGPVAASTPVLNEYIPNSNKVENIADVTENSILKVKRWQQSLPSFNQEMHCFEDAPKLVGGTIGKMNEEPFNSFSNQYNSRKNEYNPSDNKDFLGEKKKKIRTSDLSHNCYRTRDRGSISCCCRKKHTRKICSEECANKAVTQLECLQIESCSCWNGDSEFFNHTDKNEKPTLSCPVPPLELNMSSSTSGHQSSEHFKYSHKLSSVSDVSNSSRSQKIILNTKDPYTVNYSKYKKPILNSDNTSTSYCTLQLNKPIEGVGSDICQKTLSPTVKRALLNFLLNDAFCCHEATKQVETHSCGINTESPAHDITSPESINIRNKNSVDLGKCLDEINKIANLLKLQSENIVKEVTRHMHPQVP